MEKMTKKVRLGISGSSGFQPLSLVQKYLETLNKDEIEHIVSGGCAGPISMHAVAWAEKNKVVSWGVHSNESVLFDCDLLVSFWDGASQEAEHVIQQAAAFGKNVLIIYQDGMEERLA